MVFPPLPRSTARLLVLLACCTASPLWTDVAQAQQTDEATVDDAARQEFFQRKIQPVLVSKCYRCHSERAAEVEAGLRLDSRPTMRAGGDSGPAIVPGNAEASLLFERISAESDQMPPDDRLAPEVIADFREWILGGAHDPREASDALLIDPDYTDARQFWAFQPPRHAAVPAVGDPEWITTSIDNFVLARLDELGLRPAPPASPEMLIRRVYFDLIGLPPTPEEVDEYAENPTFENYSRIVDRLLASPHYGERWAQHWLDVVRYAETEGFEYDRTMPDIWRYRDYVIDSLNADKPYDQFLLEQLAGDELEPTNPQMRVAVGLHRLGAVRRNAGNQQVASSRDEVLTERTDIIGSAVLGLTVGCARCHDHKFDPIPQQDYYRLKAFFAASDEENIPLDGGPVGPELTPRDRRRLEARLAELKESLSGLTGEQAEKIQRQIDEIVAQLPTERGPTLCSIKNDLDNIWPIHVLRRGVPDLKGPPVGMRTLGVLARDDQRELPLDTPNPRTHLARSLIDPNHPLTARVMINRVWQWHFGQGLVSTANDFGANGSRPSHPELLDHLALMFVENGWRLKPLHREIVLSSTYRQSSAVATNDPGRTVDSENRWLSRFSRRRLSGEELRDAMLCVAGRLNPAMGGASVILPVEQELVRQLYDPKQWQVADEPEQHYRRSIYLFAKRNLRLPFMEVFDQPSSQTSCAARVQSTHARQALEMLNGAIANDLAKALAERLRSEVGTDIDAAIQRAYQLTASRSPSEAELELAGRFIDEVGLDEFALAMLNINAFLYVD